MATANLANTTTLAVETSNDSIVIVDNFQSIRGGRTLDVSGFAPARGNAIGTLGAITAGTLYVDGTYTNVPLTGGDGSLATADIVVSGGGVTDVTLKYAGKDYTATDSLSASNANLGGAGSGFAVVVSTVVNVGAAEVIPAGHPIIKETSSGDYKPMPVNGSALGSLPGSHTYEGILISSILRAKPFAGIMVRGTVNPAAMIYTGFSGIQSAFHTAVPLIDFRQD